VTVADPPAPALRAAFDWFFRSRRTGQVTIVQAPNLSLGIYLGATVVRLAFRPHDGFGTAVSVVATASLAWWAIDEVLRGDCPFRRVAGGAVLVGLGSSVLFR
jgi:hypothetical protein